MTIPLTEETRKTLEEIQQHLTNGFAYSFTRNVLAAGCLTEKQLSMYDRLRNQLASYYAEQEKQEEPAEQSIEVTEQDIIESAEFDFSELDNFVFNIDEDNLFND